MLLKITTAPLAPFGSRISRTCVIAMVRNYLNNTFKKTPTGTRQVTKNDDSFSVYYDKRELDDLFEQNGYVPGSPTAGQYGLRVYLGMHGDSQAETIEMPFRPLTFKGHHTAILVCTVNKNDRLLDGSTIATALEEGQICPPPLPCSSFQGEL